jgi:hypothetical protein
MPRKSHRNPKLRHATVTAPAEPHDAMAGAFTRQQLEAMDEAFRAAFLRALEGGGDGGASTADESPAPPSGRGRR